MNSDAKISIMMVCKSVPKIGQSNGKENTNKKKKKVGTKPRQELDSLSLSRICPATVPTDFGNRLPRYNGYTCVCSTPKHKYNEPNLGLCTPRMK